MDPPGDLRTFQVPTLSGRHRTNPDPKQGDASVGPDPSVGKGDTIFDTIVLS
jgi:hypothetical protein